MKLLLLGFLMIHYFVVLFAAWAIAVPSTFAVSDLLADRSMQTPVYIGVVIDAAPTGNAGVTQAFREQLEKHGYVDGRNVKIQQRWTNGNQAALPSLMRDVVERKADVIVTNGTPAAIAAKNATSSVPIVALGVADPVRAGLTAREASLMVCLQ